MEQTEVRKAQGVRLRQARERAGYREASEAARAAGVPVPTFYAHENGDRSLIKNAEVYARAFGVDIRWLIYGDATAGSESLRPVTIEVIGLAGDGLWVNRETWTPQTFRSVPACPDFPHNRQVGFQVAGHSAGSFARDGTYLVCIPYDETRRGGLRDSDEVVVENRQGALVEYVVRRVRCTPGADCFLERMTASGGTDPIARNGGDSRTLFLVVALYRPL